MSEDRIEWRDAKHGSQNGSIGGLDLVSVGHGTIRQEAMYYLDSSLPFRSSLLGQKYSTADEAKGAAERYVAAIVARLTGA